MIEIYSICDETSTKAGEKLEIIRFFPGFYWMNFEESLETYHAVSADSRWRKDWLPVFGNGGGDFYAAICESESPYFGEIVGFAIDEFEQIVEFSSISAMFLTISKSFDQGAFLCSNGRLTADYPKMRAITQQFQPDFVEHAA